MCVYDCVVCLPQVYKGLWKGSVVAVKTIVLPAVMSGQEKREKMAIMEAAISSALSHPNIMQVRFMLAQAEASMSADSNCVAAPCVCFGCVLLLCVC